MDFKNLLQVLEQRTGASPAFLLRRVLPIAVAVVVLLVLGIRAFHKSPEEKQAAQAALEAQTTGRLLVKSNRANTTVDATRADPSPDGSSAIAHGTTDQALSGLLPGKYAVVAHADGWPDTRAEASVQIGQTAEVTVNFKSGSLRLDSVPTGASVRIGGAVVGQTPLVVPQLPPGDCQFSLEYPAWPVVAFKTVITENVESTATVRLPHGRLIVESSPPGATVLLAGKPLGQTPLTVERIPAGTKKLTLQAKDFPATEVSVMVEDRGEAKVRPVLALAFPELDPTAILRSVWVPDDPNQLAPSFDSVAGPFEPRNGIVRNLHRKRLYENWLRKTYRFSAAVKAYDPASGQVEFAEQKNELSKYRILAILPAEARGDKDLPAQLAKGATFTVYGMLSAVEEPHWPAKVITFEISPAQPLH